MGCATRVLGAPVGFAGATMRAEAPHRSATSRHQRVLILIRRTAAKPAIHAAKRPLEMVEAMIMKDPCTYSIRILRQE